MVVSRCNISLASATSSLLDSWYASVADIVKRIINSKTAKKRVYIVLEYMKIFQEKATGGMFFSRLTKQKTRQGKLPLNNHENQFCHFCETISLLHDNREPSEIFQ